MFKKYKNNIFYRNFYTFKYMMDRNLNEKNSKTKNIREH